MTAASGFAVLGVEGSFLPYPVGPETVRASGLDSFLCLYSGSMFLIVTRRGGMVRFL